jgi:hypothetical protein
MFDDQHVRKPTAKVRQEEISPAKQWLAAVSPSLPNSDHLSGLTDEIAQFLNRKVRPVAKLLQLSINLLADPTSSTSSRSNQRSSSNATSFFDENPAFANSLSQMNARFYLLTACLECGSDPRPLLGLNKTGVLQTIQWKFSQRYRAQLDARVEQALNSLPSEAAELLQSEVNRFWEKVTEASVLALKQNGTLSVKKQQMLTQIEKLNTALSELHHLAVGVQRYQEYVETVKNLALFRTVPHSYSEKLRLAEQTIYNTLTHCEDVCTKFRKQFIGLVQKSVAKRLRYMANACYYPSVGPDQIREGFLLPLPKIPTSQDLSRIRKCAIKITTVLRDTLPIATVAAARDQHNVLTRAAEHLAEQTNTLTEEYLISCATLGMAVASHVTRDQLAKSIIRSGSIASSLYQASHFDQAFANSPVGQRLALPQVVFSLNGLEPCYGGPMKESALQDGRVGAYAPGVRTLQSVDKQTIAFILPLPKLLEGKQFTITPNTQLGYSLHKSPEVHVFDNKYDPNSPRVGTTIPIDSATILIPEAQRANWEHFLLQPFEQGGAGKTKEWIAAHVAYYPVGETASNYFEKKYAGLRDWVWPSGFYESTGLPIREDCGETYLLYRWHPTEETNTSEERAAGNMN